MLPLIDARPVRPLFSLRRAAPIALFLASLLPVLSSAAPTPRQLHEDISQAAIELMFEGAESASLRLPAVEKLRRQLPELDDQLREPMRHLLGSMDALAAALRHKPDNIPATLHADFNNALMDALRQVQLPASPTPLGDLPERLNYTLLLYVSRSQIGPLRPARELSGSYLALDLQFLSAGIEQDLMQATWLNGASAEQQALLKDARTRWRYIAGLLSQRTQIKAAAPFSVKKQIGLIRQNILLLRTQLNA